jgi:hypothetical protein
MDIETVSADMSQAVAQEKTTVQLQAVSPDKEKEQAAAMDTPNPNDQTITDPNLGQTINLLG